MRRRTCFPFRNVVIRYINASPYITFILILGLLAKGELAESAPDFASYGSLNSHDMMTYSSESLKQTKSRWGVGNGGDALRLNMTKAREFAAMLVQKIPDAVLKNADQDLSDFVKSQRYVLAGDLMASPHIWVQDERPTCAWTTMPSGEQPMAQTIMFSYPTCRSSIANYVDAAQLLIHESAHHFFKDEDFADRLALTLIKAWREGSMEWQAVSQENSPGARMGHGAVFDVKRQVMIVFGGKVQNDTVLNDGGIYDLATDQWQPLKSPIAPARYQPLLAVVDDKLVIWGGYNEWRGGIDWQHSGAIYDFASQKWSVLAPPATYGIAGSYHEDETAVQTMVSFEGSLYIVGGRTQNGRGIGWRYDVRNNRWQPLNPVDQPQRLAGHTAVLTEGPTAFRGQDGQVLEGPGMIIWGGYVGSDPSDRMATEAGSYYNFAKDQWRSLSETDNPGGRYGHTAVWTGEQMVVFSGASNRKGAANQSLHATGGSYDLSTDRWTAFSSQIGVERTGHTMVWDGKEVLVMGGKSRNLRTYYSDVIAFDPDNQSWRSISGAKAPSIRWLHSAVWTGNSMIIWGGGLGFYSEPENSGGVFYP